MQSYSSSTSSDSPPRLWAEVRLLFGALAWLLLSLALASYHPSDRAFSTSGDGSATRNWLGPLGAWAADLLYYAAGYTVWWLLLWVLVRLVRQWRRHDPQVAPPPAPRGHGLTVAAGLALLLAGSWTLESTRLYSLSSQLPFAAGGVVGHALGPWVQRWVGFTPSALIGLVCVVAGASLAFQFSWLAVAERIGAWIDTRFGRARQQREVQEDVRVGEQAARAREREVEREREEFVQAAPIVIEKPVLEVPQSRRAVKEKQKALFADLPDSPLPHLDLLDAPPARQETVGQDTLEFTSRLIEKKLSDFGVQVRVVAAYPGPVITRYEIEPATGVKGAQIVNLARDLARSLSLHSIRVVETIPGKNYMALELPNPRRQMIRLSEILGSQAYADNASLLTIGLGKDIVGNPMVADLAKMPHLLVAGTTGSGKSVGINAMILSLLYKASPDEVRLIMIDPKMLEMSAYEGIPHLLAPVVTDMKQAAHALNWCVAEMERRY
ncbi:MAG: DNA translocase FtsK 4TM domain-containing protein, partial [Betaproteobacteria bacterium]|nr:DNA translocase FtsK 4TM domain-containing protein [Betaproteobacteria bacterium]